MPALLIWGLAVVLAAWNPPRFAWPDPPFWKPEMVVPFWSYFDSRTFADLADVIGQVLYFVPLGGTSGRALLAAVVRRCRPDRAGTWSRARIRTGLPPEPIGRHQRRHLGGRRRRAGLGTLAVGRVGPGPPRSESRSIESAPAAGLKLLIGPRAHIRLSATWRGLGTP